jgi:hypothetical protein
MVGDIWGIDGSNLVVVIAKAASIGTSTIDNSGSARGVAAPTGGAGDSDRHRGAQRHNCQTHSYRR